MPTLRPPPFCEAIEIKRLAVVGELIRAKLPNLAAESFGTLPNCRLELEFEGS